MLKFRIGVILAAILLSGCDHHKSASQAQSEAGTAAVTQNDSSSTGQPAKTKYPRALPVALPAPISEANPPTADNGSVAAASSSDTSSETNAPTATTVSADTASSSPGAASPASDSSSASSSATLPASSPDTATSTSSSSGSPDASQLALNTTSPAPPSGDADAAQEQVVVLQTSLGQIVIQLDAFAAPKTCDNFRKLVSDGFYNHTTFHRVIPNFIIQGGDPNSKSDDRNSYGQGGPDYTVPAEISLKHDRGAVAMARLPDSINPQRESNGSQFYICVSPCPSLDGQYTVFGHVIKGMDIVFKIADQPHDKRDDPLNRIEMEASLESKGMALEEGSSINP